MPTESIRLYKCKDGYYRTSWTDEKGRPRSKSFGKVRALAQNRFSAFLLKWNRDPNTRTPGIVHHKSLRECWEAFLVHADAYYRRKDGTPTGEADNFADAMRHALELFGELPAKDFSPTAMKKTREAMILSGLAVSTINARVRKIRQVFGWLVEQEIIPSEVWYALKAVKPLPAGRAVVIDGKEITPKSTDPVKPVPDADFWDTLGHLPATLRAFLEFCYWTGARPDEACTMRPIDIEAGGRVWLYRPAQHKTLHHRKQRVILIGPKAQAVIQPMMRRDLQAFIFNPREGWQQRMKSRVEKYNPAGHDYRQWDSYKARRRNPRGGDRYDPRAVARAVARVCTAHGIPHWSPGQLRHNAATRMRREFGLDVAQAALGHSRADITQVYAELDIAKAAAAMERAG